MKLEEIPMVYRHTWSVYEAFRKLGFTDDNVKYMAGRIRLQDGSVSTTDYLIVRLEAQDRFFTVIIGELGEPFEAARDRLEALRLAVRDGLISNDDMLTIWQQSKMGDLGYFGEFTMALVQRGFSLPALAN
jgi:hypothetical protein